MRLVGSCLFGVVSAIFSLLLSGCGSALVVYDVRGNRTVSAVEIAKGLYVPTETVVPCAGYTNEFLTAQRMEVEEREWNLLMRWRDSDGGVLRSFTVPDTVTTDLRLSSTGRRLMVPVRQWAREETRGTWKLLVRTEGEAASEFREVFSLPVDGMVYSFDWIDDDRAILACLKTRAEDAADSVGEGYYLIDSRDKTAAKLDLGLCPCGWPDAAKVLGCPDRMFPINIYQYRRPCGAAVADGRARRFAIPDVRRGLFVFDSDSFRPVFSCLDVKLPYCAFNANGDVVAWGLDDWARLSPDGRILGLGRLRGWLIVDYAGGGLFYCQSRDGSDYGTVSRESRKYLVRENGEVIGELPRARWMCSRMADGRILFQR